MAVKQNKLQSENYYTVPSPQRIIGYYLPINKTIMMV
jgi:hypothetical protein